MYTVSTIAGKENEYQNGGVDEALFCYPYGLCVDDKKNIYIADYGNDCIRWISPQGEVSTLVGKEGKYTKKEESSPYSIL